MRHPLQITSEIGELKTVLIRRPGKEVENLTPKYLHRMLFDDIPFLPAIQKEHDYFATTLRNRGVEVLYLEKLMTETLHDEQIRNDFIEQLLLESKAEESGAHLVLKEYLLSFPTEQLIDKVMAGVMKREVQVSKRTHLFEMMEDYYPFYLDPMPNLYFTRDPAAVIGDGITINRLNEPARRRESLFMKYIITYHPRFAKHDIPIWSDRDYKFSIEGGDELVLSNEVVAIGVSARTTAQAIERLARNLFTKQSSFKKVLAVEIPKTRAFMHLDTVFTMVDYDKFTIHPGIQGPGGKMNIYILERGETENDLKISHRQDIAVALKEVLNLSEILLIPCGGGDIIAAPREQWNDGSNTLAIAPAVVVTYDRNYVSNELLRSHGIEVIEVPSSELARGRGGPRCMSMPILREDL
ncbi:arginine deiminase [Brevibacillus daliensis]|uniref:arginine deiminase n=1 Tax=Brevibacillus daliensis TaxID=2892995 RepID=UPI001E622E0B|nr:arginine deiminase [Brevibacillus daliensis]